MTKSNQYEDVSLNQWLTRLLPALVQATLASDEEMKRDLG
jgi:oxalate decarboxylase/phosphoglucose isomerase-like protein (cupin superfamily)